MRAFYKPRTATALIIANMIGTGVFTSLGFQLLGITSPFAILMLWAVGGVAALCGALSYAELGTRLPRSGGEYNFLGEIYHPAAGYISGWISATIGFAAPIAAVALAFSDYGAAVLPFAVPGGAKAAVAVALIVTMALIHSRSRTASGQTQLAFTAIKVGLIILFCGAGLLLLAEPQDISFLPDTTDGTVLLSPAFAVSLIYVTYAYTGWNAATYISGELEEPQKSLPWILLSGTALTAILYILLHIVFLRAAPMSAMEGQVEIGYIAARGIFGEGGGRIAGGMLALLLISSVSAMTLAGPRALQAIGEDFSSLRWLGRTNAKDVPRNAILFQSGIAVFFVLTQSFETIIVFAGSLLAFNSFLAVLGLFVLRAKKGSENLPFRVPLYPVVPLVYLAITAFTLVYVVIDAPGNALGGLALIGIGALAYLLTRRRVKTD